MRKINFLKALKLSCLVLIFSISNLLTNKAEAQNTPPKRYFRSSLYSENNFYKSGFLLDLAYFYRSTEIESDPDSSANSNVESSFFDIKLGYVFKNAFYLGGQYTIQTDRGVNYTNNGRGTGIGFGYFFTTGFDVRAYYRFNESFAGFSNGSGYQVNLGYSMPITTNAYLGIIADYRVITYKTSGHVANFQDRTYKFLQPALSLSFLFQ